MPLLASQSPCSVLPYADPQHQSPSTTHSLLRACKTMKELHQLHATIVKTPENARSPSVDRFIEACIASSIPGSMQYARSVFDQIELPRSFAWNTMMRGYNQIDHAEEAVMLFYDMLYFDHLLPDRFTFPFLLKSCTKLNAIEEGRQCHAHVIKRALDGDDYVIRSLVRMYVEFADVENAMKVFLRRSESVGIVPWNDMILGCCKVGDLVLARRLFDEMPQRNSVSWSVLIDGYVKNGDIDSASLLFDEITEKDGFLWNSMIAGYMGCGKVETAQKLFDEMPERNVVSWTSMISGYSRNSLFKEALGLFHEMQNAKVRPSKLTLLTVLPAITQLGALVQGRWIHAYIKKMNIEIDGILGSALIDMYSKCGSIDEAIQLFEDLPRKELSTWNSMISGLAAHGLASQALSIFSRLLDLKLVPNEITFTAVLNACSHGGLVDEGQNIFSFMANKYNISPNIMHYGCMVDILCRAGYLQEARDLIDGMSEEPNSVIWKTLLSGCRIHGNKEIIKEMAKDFIELEPRESGSYVLLSTLYADAGMLDEGSNVRRRMNDRKVHKTAGCSWIEVNGNVHEFLVGGERLHAQCEEICSLLVQMDKLLKQELWLGG